MLLERLKPFFYWSVFGFYALILFIPDAYDLFAAILVVLSIFWVACKRPYGVLREDFFFACFLAAFPLLMVPSLLVKGGEWRYFDYTIRALLFVPLIVGLRSFAEAARFEFYIYYGAATGGLAAAAFSLLSIMLHPAYRVGAPITNPIAFGQIAAILGIISLAGLFKFDKGKARVFFGLAFLASTFSVVASGSGGALLGFMAGTFLLLIWSFRLHISFSYRLYFLALFVLAASLLTPLLISKYIQINSDILSTLAGNGMGTSQGQRLIMWSMALKSFSQNLVFGVGPGHGHAVFVDFCKSNICTSDFSRFKGVHNQYLDVLMNAGLIGFSGWLVFVIGVLGLLARKLSGANPIAAATGLSVFLSMLVSVFSQGLYHHNIYVLIFFFSITFLWFMASSPAKISNLGYHV